VVLDDAIVRVPASFARLSALADFSAIIQNDSDHQPPHPSPAGTTWDDLRACFQDITCSDTSAAHEAALRAKLLQVLDVLPPNSAHP
jgi:hypothetical protein